MDKETCATISEIAEIQKKRIARMAQIDQETYLKHQHECKKEKHVDYSIDDDSRATQRHDHQCGGHHPDPVLDQCAVQSILDPINILARSRRYRGLISFLHRRI